MVQSTLAAVAAIAARWLWPSLLIPSTSIRSVSVHTCPTHGKGLVSMTCYGQRLRAIACCAPQANSFLDNQVPLPGPKDSADGAGRHTPKRIIISQLEVCSSRFEVEAAAQRACSSLEHLTVNGPGAPGQQAHLSLATKANDHGPWGSHLPSLRPGQAAHLLVCWEFLRCGLTS